MLFELKNYIGIDYDDRDVTLLLHLEASKRYFKNNYGVEEKDFDEDESIKELLFERCRYADANGLEMFEQNFKASKRYFKNNYGVEEKDFDEDESIKELLFERCRYADANGLEMFEQNFKSDLLNLAFRMAVNKRAGSKDDTEETTT